MSNPTKGCNLTEKEIRTLIAATMQQTLNTHQDDVNLDETIERLKYLNSRLKAFKEPEANKEPEVKTEVMPAAPSGWGASA